jgi:hypothetical protein
LTQKRVFLNEEDEKEKRETRKKSAKKLLKRIFV